MRETAAGFERRAWKRKEKVIKRETERTKLGSRASRREGKRGTDGASDGPCSHQQIDTFADPPAELGTSIWLVWCTGQAWICMLDLGRDRPRPIVDLAVMCRRPCAGSERAETACGAERKECGGAI